MACHSGVSPPDHARFSTSLLMRRSLTALARARRDRSLDHAAGDPIAGISRWLADIIVGFCMHDEGCAVAIEDRLFAVAQRDRVADHRSVNRSVRRCILIRQVTRMRTMRREKAVQLVRLEAQIRSG